MSKKFKIFLIILLSVIAISLTGLMILLINGKVSFPNIMFGHKVSNELVVDRQYENVFEKIYVDTDAGDIYIKPAINNQVSVKVYGEEDKVTVNVSSNNELSIFTKTSDCFGICFNFKISKIEIYLPREYAKKIELINNYGDIFIDEFTEADIDINEDCGNVKIAAGNIVTVNNSYGDIILDKASVATITGSAGDIKIGKVMDAYVENAFGDIEIDKVDNYLNIQADSGDIMINEIALKKDSSIKNDFGDVEIGLTNELYIDAKTDLGDVKIRNNYNKSEITLKIINDCGDIEVDN